MIQFFEYGGSMRKEATNSDLIKCIDVLKDFFLFKGLDSEDIRKIIESDGTELKRFCNCETVYSPQNFSKSIGIVINGKCIVNKLKTDGSYLPLNELTTGSSFGILAVFSCEDEFPTVITVKGCTDILFLSDVLVKSIVNTYNEASLNVINFLCNRVRFLNKKISSFSADSADEKLVVYLLNKQKSLDSIEFTLNVSQVGKALNLGRASVYRAIRNLCQANLITYDNKKIIILDPNGLERFSK